VINPSFSTRITAYFGGLFVATIGVILAIWYFGFPPLGLSGAKENWLTESAHELEILASHQQAAIANTLEESRGAILSLAENKVIAHEMATDNTALPKEAERLFDRLVRAYPDRFREILFLDVVDGKILGSGTGADIGSPFPNMALPKRAAQPGATEMAGHPARGKDANPGLRRQ